MGETKKGREGLLSKSESLMRSIASSCIYAKTGKAASSQSAVSLTVSSKLCYQPSQSSTAS